MVTHTCGLARHGRGNAETRFNQRNMNNYTEEEQEAVESGQVRFDSIASEFGVADRNLFGHVTS